MLTLRKIRKGANTPLSSLFSSSAIYAKNSKNYNCSSNKKQVVLNELKAINETMKPQIFVLDVTSGDYPSDILRSWGVPVEPFKFTIPSKIQIMNNLKILMQQRRLQIPGTEHAKELIDQLEIFEYKISDTNQDRMMLRAPEGFHDDEVDALALMCHGLSRGLGFVYSSFIERSSEKKPDTVVEKGIQANKGWLDYLEKNAARSF